MLLKVVKNCGDSFEILNRVGKIAICVICQGADEHVPLVFSLIVKIRSAMNKENCSYIGILIWVLLKASGTVYKIKSLVKFSDKSVEDYVRDENLKFSIVDFEEFGKILRLERTIFSKDQRVEEKFKQEVFRFEDRLGEGSNIEELDDEENDEEFLGFNISENEFSSASSMDFQERIIDPHDVKPEIVEDDYTLILMQQEEFDKNFLNQISSLSQVH